MTDVYKEGQKVTIRRLGDVTPGEFRGFVRGTYGTDYGGDGVHPMAYIVEMTDYTPGQVYSCLVVASGCVDEGWDE